MLCLIRLVLGNFLIERMWRLGVKGGSFIWVVRWMGLEIGIDVRGRETRLSRIIPADVQNLNFRYPSP